MKIAVLNGSPRKGNTAALVEAFAYFNEVLAAVHNLYPDYDLVVTMDADYTD